MKTLFRIFVLQIFLCLTLSANAQVFSSEIWHEGRLVLVDYDTLKGLVKYDLERDLVQFQEDQKIQTFSARKVIYFEIFDIQKEDYRHFYALPYRVKRNYKVPLFFEVLYQGKLSLLSREVIEEENVSQYGYSSPVNNSTNRKRLVLHYYFIGKDGEIVDYNKKKKGLYEIMKKKEGEIRRYMRSNKLKADRHTDLILITEYYNEQLKE